LLEFAVKAEEVGFDSVVVSDHFQPWRHTGGHSPYSFAWLAALGERTSRVRLGTSVVTPTFRYHPSIVAQAMGTLGCLAPGRVFLGVGTGESLNETPSIGVEWPEFKERFARLKEGIALMQQLWTEDQVTFDGDYYQTRSATIYDKPADPVPLYIAGSGAVAARYAGRVADGFICTSGKKPELYRETLLPAVAEGVEKAGRDPSQVELMIEMKVSFDTDSERAMEDTRHWGALALSQEERWGWRTRWRWSAWPMPYPWSGRPAAGSSPATRTSKWSASSPISSSASRTSSFMPPVPTRSASCASMRKRFCRACAILSSDAHRGLTARRLNDASKSCQDHATGRVRQWFAYE
jgi:coenzyme F420-dependent glucose-6-phosphate dehydrogenase